MADSKISALPASTTPLAGTEVLPIVQSSTTKQVSVANLTAGRDIAATSLTTAAVQATNSGGLTLKNSNGTTQLSLGAGGGDNITLSVATNITPANAAVTISPTGTGTVAISPTGALTINPTAASTLNNVSVGATTALTGRFTNVTLTTGNLVVASGQGIDFSATADGPNRTSELLNDYEEGTWSPSIGGSTTYTDQVGYYTKCGNVVTVSGRMAINSQAGNANTYQITNLPFTSKTTGNAKAGGGTIGTYSGLAISVIALSSYVEGNTTNMVFTYVVVPANSNLTATIFGNNADIYFSATYLSA